MRQIKLTYVGFRAHVKIASRIVSYRIAGLAWAARGEKSRPYRAELRDTGPTRAVSSAFNLCAIHRQVGPYKVQSDTDSQRLNEMSHYFK